MAPTPALSGAQRNALRVQIAAKRAAQLKAENDARSAKDKEFVAKPAKTKNPSHSKGRVLSGTPSESTGKVKAGGRTVRTRTRNPNTVVQGSSTRAPGKPPVRTSIADEVKQKAMARRAAAERSAKRPSRAVTPQAEKPKNPNYKAPAKRTYPGPGEQGHQDRHHKDPASEYQGGDGQRPMKHPDWGKPLPKGQKQPAPQSGRSRQREDAEKDPNSKAKISKGGVPGLVPRGPFKASDPMGTGPIKSSPGMGAPTGGTGRDADGGKQRGQFENDRREGMAGQGKDRPPVYKPQDDGERGGYTNRTSRGPVRPIPPYQAPGKPKGKIPPMKSPGGMKVNSTVSTVRGLMPR